MSSDEKPVRTKGTRTAKRATKVSELHQLQALRERAEALALARTLALAGLPRRRTQERSLSRTFRTGLDTWVRITYEAHQGFELAYGADRLVLAGIQHLAIQHDTPLIRLSQASELLRLFGLPVTGKELTLLRERLDRVRALSIHIGVAPTREAVERASIGEQTLVVSNFWLPSREDLKRERLEAFGQLRLAGNAEGWDDAQDLRYGVQLSRDFFVYLKRIENRLLVPLDLLRLFTDRPVAWDYALFLVARCGAARSESVIDHDTLLEMFRDGSERDRKTFERLQQHHTEIMQATAGKLNARLEEAKPAKSTGGRPAKRWCLRVGPSESLLGQSASAPILIEGRTD